MKPCFLDGPNSRRRQDGSARTFLLATVAFALGAALTTLWLRSRPKAATQPPAGVELSDNTKAVLQHLTQPVEIRFYSLLDPNAPAALRQFSGRVEQLLSIYQQQSTGKLTVGVYDSTTNTTPNAALADGIKGFDLDKGEGSYLGVALSSGGKKDALPQLAPEWESALEADLSRAIARVSQAGLARSGPALATRSNIVEEVKQKVPNYQDISLEDGSRILRELSMKEFGASVSEAQTKVQEAQKRLQDAKNSGSTREQEAALKQLQELQNAQSQKLQDIAIKSHQQIEALKQLKKGN